ncbi:MAG: 50S ribosomal protein L13 [archaeon]
MMTIDLKGLVAGRVATKIAKALINGESVVAVNAESVVIVGRRENIVEKYKLRVDARVLSNPHFGPKYSRVPSNIFKKMVRNMLPTKGSTKDRMIKKLKVYNLVPKELAKEKMESFEDYKCNERHSFMTMKELSLELGARW